MKNFLDGEKIEKLLWENGLDFDHHGPEKYLWHLNVYSGAVRVTLPDTYLTPDGWKVDGEKLDVEVWRDGELIDEYDETFRDEEALVQKILTYVE